ncbi:MAG: stage 0 sporulation protein [Ruminococcaceae bacterium]|nr:stage 0 sporulation protein [Oscillospiraceae bacterium]
MHAIVETARGPEYGEVVIANSHVSTDNIVPPLRPVLRAATEEDARHQEENKKKEQEAFRICLEKIAAHGLDMKLVEAQYTFDNSKLLFYFTSDGRVDFRELVKDLAGVFRTRIELRQIGIRDEAKLLGGLGTCGRPLCCAGFLSDFGQVSIKMAKEQNLSLNSTKISGCCGRLMCCLRYEHETYEEEIRLTPTVDSVVETRDGRGTVVGNHLLKGTVTVRLESQEGEAPRTYHRDEVKVLRAKGERRDKTDTADKVEE